jgi:hypothetical protein
MTGRDPQARKPAWYTSRIYAVTTDADREAVLYFQRVFGLKETGELDDGTVSHIRGLQMLAGIRTTGIIDDATAEEIERIFPYGA